MKYKIVFVLLSALSIYTVIATSQDQDKNKSKETLNTIQINGTDVAPLGADLTAKPKEEQDARAKIEKSVFSRAPKSSFNLGSLGCPPDMKCQDQPPK